MLGAQRLWERLGGWARRAAAAVLSSAHRPVPRHVAFIMDGNRRYAEARQLRKVEGHAYGYQRLIDALEWCLELGVSCVSVYAFSIDNYRRSGEEVTTLMQLAEEKLAHMLQVGGVHGCSSSSRGRRGSRSRASRWLEQGQLPPVPHSSGGAPAARPPSRPAAASAPTATAAGARCAGAARGAGPGDRRPEPRAARGAGGGRGHHGCHAAPRQGGAQPLLLLHVSDAQCLLVLVVVVQARPFDAGKPLGVGSSQDQAQLSLLANVPCCVGCCRSSEELLQAMDGLAVAQQCTPTSSSLDFSSSSSSSSSSCGGGMAAFESALYTRGCPPVDLLVRTSGETRLSDFMLWQSRHALLVFTQVLWPDFGFLDLVAAVQQFQRHAAHLQRLREAADAQAVAAASTAAAAVAAASTAAAAVAAVAAAAGEEPGAWQQQQEQPLAHLQLPAIKVAPPQQRQQHDSPSGVASPASPSSPSSRSDASEEAAAAAAVAAAGPLLRYRPLPAAQQAEALS